MGVMRPLLILFLFACCASAQLGIQSPFFNAAILKGAAAGGGAGDSNSSGTNETYEGTGTSVAGWNYGDNTSGNITNVDFTTSPAPLAGSQSLLLRNVASSSAAYTTLFTPAGTTQMHVRWMMNITNTIVNNMRLFVVFDGVAAIQMQIQVQSSGLRVVCGTQNATTASTLSANTLYYCWADYVKGSGANATAKIGFSTTKTRPSGGGTFASLSNGSSTGDARETGPWVVDVSFGSGFNGVIFDNVSMNLTSEIGDFP